MAEKLDAQLVLQSISELGGTVSALSGTVSALSGSVSDLRVELRENTIALQELFAKTEAQFARTDERMAALSAKTDAQIAKTAAQMAKTDAQMAKTDAQIAKTDAKLDRIGQQLADIGFSNGDAAEDWFYSSLEERMCLGGVRFDTIERNVHKKKKRVEDEYDILMTNGDCVALIEVKYKVNTRHIVTLSTRKIENFRELFPDYARYNIYVAIAGMSYEPLAEDWAHDAGVAVLKQRGDHLEVNAEGMRAF